MKTEEPDFTDPRALRKQAEKILQQKKAQAKLDEESEVDAKKLLHELQVHQIELEMQNEELYKAYEAAEAALKKYTLVFDQAPMGFVTLESDGTITELNFTSAEMLGDRRFSLIGSNFKLYISDESKNTFNSFFTNVYTSHKKESCHVMLGYEDKPLFQVYIEGIVIENDSKCLLSIVNISKLK
jgi:PAS domain-containing protein